MCELSQATGALIRKPNHERNKDVGKQEKNLAHETLAGSRFAYSRITTISLPRVRTGGPPSPNCSAAIGRGQRRVEGTKSRETRHNLVVVDLLCPVCAIRW